MSEETVVCPADGCEYEGLRNSVAAHFSGTKDTAHKGGYERAKTLMESTAAADGGEKSPGSGDLAPSEFPGASSSSPEPGSGGGDIDGGDDIDEELSCPACGETSELYETEAVLRSVPNAQVSPKQRGLLQRSDAVCGTCGGVFDVE